MTNTEIRDIDLLTALRLLHDDSQLVEDTDPEDKDLFYVLSARGLVQLVTTMVASFGQGYGRWYITEEGAEVLRAVQRAADEAACRAFRELT